MKKLTIFILFCIKLLANPIVVDSNFTQISSTQYTTFAKSELNTTMQDVQKLNFTPNLNPNFGIGNFAIWSKIELYNKTSKATEIYLTNLRAGIDEIDVYLFFGNNEKATFILGDDRINSLRDNTDRFSSFSTIVEPNESVVVLARQANFHGPVEANWLVQSKQEYIKSRFYDTLFWGAFVGLMMALIVYNFSIFFAIKKQEYIYYAGLGLFSLLSQLQVSGILHAIAPDFLVVTVNNITFFTVVLSILCAIAFNYHFFEVKKNFSKFKSIFYALFCIFSILFVIGLIDINLTIKYLIVTTVLVTITLLFLLIVGLLSYRLKLSGTYFYIIGQGVLFATYILTTIAINSKNAITIWTYITIPTSIFIEMVFLSFALSVRVKNINDLRQKQEKLIIFFAHINSLSGMLNSILHQWKKPIGRLGAIFTELEIAIQHNKNPIEKLNNNISQINYNLAILQNTTQEFYNLYKNYDESERVDIFTEIAKIESVLIADIESNNIVLNYEALQNLELVTYRHPFFHAFFIIINNAFEVAVRRNISTPSINIQYKNINCYTEFYIQDNCGGINQDPIESIFQINITDDMSDKAIKGSGLAIAKMLVEERLGGKIDVTNNNNGALFIVKIPSARNVSLR